MKKIVLIILTIFSLTSCSKSGPYLQILAGNLASAKGDYQKAVIEYSKVEEESPFYNRAQFNLATVYGYLGENEVAMETWKLLQNDTDEELRYRTFYNIGVTAFHSGNYREAYDYFLEALKMNSADLEVKVNLELAYKKIRSEIDTTVREAKSNSEEIELNDQNHVLEYVKSKEKNRWKARGQESPELSSNDW